MENNKFSFKARLRSFTYACNGIVTLIAHTHNARIHLFAAVCTVIAGGLLGLSASEWIVITFAIAAVFMAEAFNSAIEYLADLISPDYHPLIKKAKDIAAAAVLIIAIAAAIAGLIIFIPKITPLC